MSILEVGEELPKRSNYREERNQAIAKIDRIQDIVYMVSGVNRKSKYFKADLNRNDIELLKYDIIETFKFLPPEMNTFMMSLVYAYGKFVALHTTSYMISGSLGKEYDPLCSELMSMLQTLKWQLEK